MSKAWRARRIYVLLAFDLRAIRSGPEGGGEHEFTLATHREKRKNRAAHGGAVR